MALDTVLEKPLCSCEAATTEELDKLVRDICERNDLDASRLARCIFRCAQEHVPFDKLHHLRIIGDEDGHTLEIFEQNDIAQGFYLNADATWLLLLLPERSDPGDYLCRFSDALESLSIRNASMHSLDLGALPGLKRLHLENDVLLECAEGFYGLPVLEQLTIENCPKLKEHPGMETVRSLIELNLRRCASLTELDLSVFYNLFSLDLSGCENLIKLDLAIPGILDSGFHAHNDLTYLNLYGCKRLMALNLSEHKNLEELNLSVCESLTKLDFSDCDSLSTIIASGCSGLRVLLGLPPELIHLNLSGSTSLTKLDLYGCESITNLNLSGCESLTKLDLYRCKSLTELDLSKCGSLTKLNLSWCESIARLNLSGCRSLIELTFPNYDHLYKIRGVHARLTSLDLSDCESLTSLHLYECDSLVELDVSGCRSLNGLVLSFFGNPTGLRGVEKLTGLRRLELTGDETLVNLFGLENYTQLTLLVLGQCSDLTALCKFPTSLTDLEIFDCEMLTELDISGCNNLTSLSISGCESLTELDFSCCRSLEKLEITECFRLTNLNLSGCYDLWLLDLSECESLTNLDLSGCSSLGNLPELPDCLTHLDLSGCDSLTALDLSDCERLTELHGLETLTQLVTMSLSACGKLTTLDLSGCECLTELDLSGCRSIEVLKGLENLKQLTNLTLPEYSALNTIPDGIRSLPSLRRLDLRYMQLADLPDWLPEIAEEFTLDFNWSSGKTKAVVLLKGTKVEGVDMSIFERPYEMVVKWFEERKAGRFRPLNEIKVIFLGDGEAGKSYTISRLVNNGGNPVGYEGVRTPGIAIKPHLCQFQDRKFRVNYWDFGGQEIMHAMHRIFLTNRTMYVVLVSASDPEPIVRARYWLRNIKSFAPDAPVLLVLNKIDIAPHVSMELSTLQKENGNLIKMVYLSALEFDQQKFDAEFRSILLQEILNTKMLDAAWPKSWIDVKSRMENLGKYYIPIEEYEEICADYQVEDVQTELLDWFNDLGISFCFRDNFRLENQVILEPRWITNGLYIILFNHCKGAKNGMVPHMSIHDLLKRTPKDTSINCTDRSARYKIPGDAEYVLGIMRQFGLSLQISDDTEFIPMLCTKSPAMEVEQLERDENVLEYHMVFGYLPNNVIHRLMVERYGELDKDNVWKSGARFVQPGTGLSAVVAMEDDVLKFYISHTDLVHEPKTYLTTLKAHVERILQKMNLRVSAERLAYKYDGKYGVFDYEELKHNYANNIRKVYSSVWKREINIADILDPFAQRCTTETKCATISENTDPIALLNAIRRSCQTIQDEPVYRLVPGANSKDMEDLRNRRVRDDLGKEGYNVTDQSQRGSGKTGRGVGEVDLMVRDDNNEPRTIIEALRVSDGTKAPWDRHLDKLLGKYNTRGYPVLYLLTYVDADPRAFGRILIAYQKHAKTYAPKKYTCCKCEILDHTDNMKPQYTKVIKCRYQCRDYTPTVYHIFVRIPTTDE